MPPTASQILQKITASQGLTSTPSISGDAFECLIRAIVLQLLASCYTILPASSACSPLSRQRTRARPTTALRLHSQYRFEPAAGHHARVPSETASWPGLYAGAELEDAFAEVVSTQRLQRYNRDYVPLFTANGWTDGASSSPATHSARTSRSRRHSSSPSEPGF
jgi:hypothetical protein